MKLNRFKKTCEKLGVSGARIKMSVSDIGHEFFVLTEEEIEFILGKKLKK